MTAEDWDDIDSLIQRSAQLRTLSAQARARAGRTMARSAGLMKSMARVREGMLSQLPLRGEQPDRDAGA